MSEEQFDNFIEDLDDDLLEGVEMILDETIGLNEKKPGLLGKIGGAIASRIPGTSAKRKRVIKKAATREKQRGAKAKKIATKRKEKQDYAKAKTKKSYYRLCE